MFKRYGWALLLLLPLASFAVSMSSSVVNLLRIDPAFSRANIGIVIASAKTGKILYQRHANHLFTPASVQKLLTASAALLYLKPNYRFKTELLARGKIVNHVLVGDLWVKFGGDPTLTSQQIDQLFVRLKKLGVHQISGRVFIDDSAYNQVPYPPGWVWDDLSYDYAAPLRTIIINQNRFVLRLVPAQQVGKQPHVETNLPHGVIRIANFLRTTDRPPRFCPLTIYSGINGHYVLRGCIDKRDGRGTRVLAVRDVARYAKVVIAQALTMQHIIYKGPVTIHSRHHLARVLLTHRSAPLSKVIYHMLKESNNLMTDALLKKLGEKYFQEQGSWQNGLRALKRILAKPTGINFKRCLLTDGAGLSRYNLLSPRQVVKVLQYDYHNRLIWRPLYHALPIAGIDGTLERRMLKEAKSRRIHAKTGSMTGVSALAGYVRSKHHGMLEFVIMVNGFVKPRAPFVHLENRLCLLLGSY